MIIIVKKKKKKICDSLPTVSAFSPKVSAVSAGGAWKNLPSQSSVARPAVNRWSPLRRLVSDLDQIGLGLSAETAKLQQRWDDENGLKYVERKQGPRSNFLGEETLFV